MKVSGRRNRDHGTPGSPKYSKIHCVVFLIRQFIQQAKFKVREQSEHPAINDLRAHY